MRRPIYVLESDDSGHYLLVEHAWHSSELELITRRSDTIEFVEILAEYIQGKLLEISDVNNILRDNNCSFYHEVDNNKFNVIIKEISEIEFEVSDSEIKNIRILVERMENALELYDYPGVLHSSASIFETLAKDIIDRETVGTESLGGFFELYRKKSYLPEPMIDYVLEIYQRRNTEPLAGHGSRKESNITKKEAVIIVQITKAIIKIERELMIEDANPEKN